MIRIDQCPDKRKGCSVRKKTKLRELRDVKPFPRFSLEWTPLKSPDKSGKLMGSK